MIFKLFLSLYLFTIVIFKINSTLIQDNQGGIANNSEELFETQQTICQINTLQLAATAKATVTRALKGVCLSRSMEEHFKKVEKLLKTQLELLNAIEIKMASVASNRVWRSAQMPEPLVAATTLPWDVEEFQHKSDEVEVMPHPREFEIKRYNGTVHQEGNGKSIFTYYWKLQDIEQKLSNRKSVRSSNIYVTPGGYSMYMKLSTTQNGDTIYIQAGLSHGSFDETLLWPFRLKHRLSILDQTTVNFDDIQSRIWNPSVLCSNLHWQKPSMKSDNFECVALGILNNVLHTKSYLYSNSLIVKLTVYLE